jgi:hypothetical protein
MWLSQLASVWSTAANATDKLQLPEECIDPVHMPEHDMPVDITVTPTQVTKLA